MSKHYKLVLFPPQRTRCWTFTSTSWHWLPSGLAKETGWDGWWGGSEVFPTLERSKKCLGLRGNVIHIVLLAPLGPLGLSLTRGEESRPWLWELTMRVTGGQVTYAPVPHIYVEALGLCSKLEAERGTQALCRRHFCLHLEFSDLPSWSCQELPWILENCTVASARSPSPGCHYN